MKLANCVAKTLKGKDQKFTNSQMFSLCCKTSNPNTWTLIFEDQYLLGVLCHTLGMIPKTWGPIIRPDMTTWLKDRLMVLACW